MRLGGGCVSFHGYEGDGYVYDTVLSLSPKGTFSSAFVYMSLTSLKKAQLHLKDCYGFAHLTLCTRKVSAFLQK